MVGDDQRTSAAVAAVNHVIDLFQIALCPALHGINVMAVFLPDLIEPTFLHNGAATSSDTSTNVPLV